MGQYGLGIAAALLFGIQTALCPCPLATNIVAISYIGRRVGNPAQVFMAGLLYTLGRTAVYLALGMVLMAGLFSVPGLSMFLQKYMNRFLGPLLIILSMFLLELLRGRPARLQVSEKMQRRVEALGIWGAGLLGILFALAFCPVSAAWFFGTLIPLCVKADSRIILPIMYGVGTALPVIVFAILIAVSARSIGAAFRAVTQIELWARRIAGFLFLAVGLFYTLRYIFEWV